MRSSFILDGMTRFCVMRIKRNILIFWSSGWIYKCQEDIVDLHATIYYIYFANDKWCAPFQGMYATMRLYYAPGAPIKSNVLRRNTREINDSLESKRISASLRVAHIHTRADSRQAQRLESVRIQWLNLLLTKYIRRSFCDTQARAIIVHSDSADLINYRNIYNYYLTFLVVRRRRATDLCMRSYAELQSPMHVLDANVGDSSRQAAVKKNRRTRRRKKTRHSQFIDKEWNHRLERRNRMQILIAYVSTRRTKSGLFDSLCVMCACDRRLMSIHLNFFVGPTKMTTSIAEKYVLQKRTSRNCAMNIVYGSAAARQPPSTVFVFFSSSRFCI